MALLTELVALITVASFAVQPHLRQSFDARPWEYILPGVALTGLLGSRLLASGGARFWSSCVFLIGMLGSAALGLYPNVLPSNSDPALSLTVYNAAAGAYGLRVGLFWFAPGMLLATAYFVYTYRSFAGKLRAEDQGY